MRHARQAALYEVITHGAGNIWTFENRMAHVLAGDCTPLSAVDIFVTRGREAPRPLRPQRFQEACS
jgi:hypothetical protein